ncbi:MAG: IMP dehydrogenase [Candidatus Marinamargulisbacteria bacterium]|jgi:IMP dehydrogenase
MTKNTEKKFSRAYGLDEIALVPSYKTLDPDLVDISTTIAGVKLDIPIFASAMDSVISPETASKIGKLGAIGVLNLEGVQTRYDNPNEVLEKISSVDKQSYVPLMQEIYTHNDVRDDLVRKRIKEIKATGVITAVSATPQSAQRLGPIAAESGADIFVIQSTVVSPNYQSKDGDSILDLTDFCKMMPIPVLVGNTTTYPVTKALMATGVQGVFIGIGPGAACTTRGVLGIGVPMASAITQTCAARNDYFEETGRYVPIIADGGIVNSGDICKSLACGADAVMIGSPFAKATEAPGRGFHWGMATPNAVLPRGSRIEVGTIASLKEILIGPSKSDDGSQNLAGAITTCFATLGVSTIKEMHDIEVVVAPSLITEGKIYQKAQGLGMYK